jgi:hypothetical protein
MAIRDDWRENIRDRTNGGTGMTVLALAIGVVIALLIGMWLFVKTPLDTGMTRTSAPTTQPDTNKGGTSKQP